MAVHLSKTAFLGQEAIVAGNDDVQMTIIPSWGSNLISLVAKSQRESDIELLRVPTTPEEFHAKPALFGDPILFPPNRIADGKFMFEGRTYQFKISDPKLNNHQHGFVQDRPWRLVRHETMGGKVRIITQFDSAEFAEVMQQFAHHFTIDMEYLLDGSTITKTATITNLSDQAFPWGLGYHTTFRFPIAAGGSLDHCTFALSAKKHWQLSERMLPTGILQDLDNFPDLETGMKLTGIMLDDAFLADKVDGGNRAVMYDEDLDLKITYSCDDHFTQWVIYNADGTRGFLCPEPYTWITNAPNLDLPASLTGLKVLQPGEKCAVKTILHIERAGE